MAFEMSSVCFAEAVALGFFADSASADFCLRERFGRKGEACEDRSNPEAGATGWWALSGGAWGAFTGRARAEREDSRRGELRRGERTPRLSFPAARRGEVSDRASPEGCQIKGRPRFTRDDGVSPGRPPPENGAFARDATYLGAFRDARVFRGGDLRMVKGRERSATATRPSRRASVAEGSRTRCDVVRGGNAGGVRLGARRERRRTMMGDSYFTSVSTGGIGMAPGLLRRKRPARRSLSQSTRARPHSTNSAFRVGLGLPRRAAPDERLRGGKSESRSGTTYGLLPCAVV